MTSEKYALTTRTTLVWVVGMGFTSGVLAGSSSFVFLEILGKVITTQQDHPWLVFGLTGFGLLWGMVIASHGSHLGATPIYRKIGGLHERGTHLGAVLAPSALLGTWAAHLFGAPVGREGAAIQVSAGLTDSAARRLGAPTPLGSTILVAAVAGGFGSVFGVPIAGVLFALETAGLVWSRRSPSGVGHAYSQRLMWPLVGSVIAASVGDRVVSLFGHQHARRPRFEGVVDPPTLWRLLLLGAAIGLAARGFVGLKNLTHSEMASRFADPRVRLAVGGAALTVLLLLAGAEYRNLSLGLIDSSLLGETPPNLAFAIKLVLTAVAVGCGFPGGEVTPLFAVGSTLGATVAAATGGSTVAFASLGLVAVFCAASRAPLCAIVMAWELFGSASVVGPMIVVMAVAMALAPTRGLYSVDAPLTTPTRGGGTQE